MIEVDMTTEGLHKLAMAQGDRNLEDMIHTELLRTGNTPHTTQMTPEVVSLGLNRRHPYQGLIRTGLLDKL